MAASLGAVDALAGNIERLAGRDIRAQVMQGAEQLTATTKPAKVALWVQGAMERLDALVNEPTRAQIMLSCGHNCAQAHPSVTAKIRARRRQYATEDEFLEAEVRRLSPGSRMERDGNVLRIFYTPREFRRPMRCYCSLLRGLPEGETVSPTYCQCSRGFTQAVWEATLGRPLRVEIADSCVTGAEECQFVIHL
jgi:hypothetical protein